MVNEESYDAVARFYDLEYSERPEESRFYIEYARELGPPVLELGCGTGKVLIPIAKSGMEVWGLDLSEGMLNMAREKVKLLDREIASRITLKRGDVRNFSLSKKFNLILVPASFQNLITTEDQEKALRCIHSHLTTGGLLVVDLISPQLLAKATKRIVKEIGDGKGGKITITQFGEDDFNRTPPIIRIRRTYEEPQKNGTLKTTSWSEIICYITKEEMEHLLNSEGFKVLDVYRNFNKDPYDAQIASDMHFIAKPKFQKM